MSALVIDRRGLSIKAESGCLVIRADGLHTRSVPIAGLSKVILHHNVVLDTSTLGILQAAGVPVVVLNHRYDSHSFALVGQSGKHAVRRLRQYWLYGHLELRQLMAAQVLNAKFGGQLKWLREMSVKRPEHRFELLRAERQIQQIRLDIAIGELSIDALRGKEGAAQKIWFEAYRQCLPDSLGFTERQRRPPPDPVNSALSWLYTRLYFETLPLLAKWQLEPAVGFFHLARDGRASLACDLMEPLRPLADGLICSLFNSQTLRLAHFRKLKHSCVIGAAGRKHLTEALEREMPAFRRKLGGYIRMLAKQIDSYPMPGE